MEPGSCQYPAVQHQVPDLHKSPAVPSVASTLTQPYSLNPCALLPRRSQRELLQELLQHSKQQLGMTLAVDPAGGAKVSKTDQMKNRAHRRERYLVEVTKTAEATASQRFSTKGQREVLNAVLALLHKHLHPADEQQTAILASMAMEQLARLTHSHGALNFLPPITDAPCCSSQHTATTNWR